MTNGALRRPASGRWRRRCRSASGETPIGDAIPPVDRDRVIAIAIAVGLACTFARRDGAITELARSRLFSQDGPPTRRTVAEACAGEGFRRESGVETQPTRFEDGEFVLPTGQGGGRADLLRGAAGGGAPNDRKGLRPR